MFYIYKITNLINNKIYIGKTNNVEVRYKAHIRTALRDKRTSQDCVKFYASIRKYGATNFSKPEIIASYNEEDEAYKNEKYFIALYDSFKNGLNACPGGKGVFGSGNQSAFHLHKESILEKRSAKKNSMEKISERFYTYVQKEAECWNWLGGTIDVYGTFRFKGKNKRSHIVAWIIERGEVPDGYYVSHKCNNKLCVNHNHLLLITRQELNKITNGQENRQGSNNKNSKLTEEQVKEILSLYTTNKESISAISRKYNVGKTTISNIVKGRKWKAITFDKT